MQSKNGHAGQQNWLAFRRGGVDSSLPVSLKVAHEIAPREPSFGVRRNVSFGSQHLFRCCVRLPAVEIQF